MSRHMPATFSGCPMHIAYEHVLRTISRYTYGEPLHIAILKWIYHKTAAIALASSPTVSVL